MTHQDPGLPLYGEQTALTLANLSFSGERLSDYPEFIAAGAAVKQAAALANRDTGRLDPDKARRIVAACTALATGRHLDQFPIDPFHGGGGIGLNMNLNEVIATLAGPDVRPIGDVNASQSTADACHTAMHLALIAALDRTSPVIADTMAQLERLAAEAEGVHTIARTCWQDGMAVGADALFTALAAALARQLDWWQHLRGDLLQINLGGTVIGSGEGAGEDYRRLVPGRLADVTGLPLVLKANLYDAAQYPDDIARLSTAVRAASALVAKFAQDLRLLSSGPECGLAEIALPAVQAGSSFFPGKVNPVVCETAIQCDLVIGGHDAAVQRALGMGEVHLNLWEFTMGFLTLKSLRQLAASTDRFNRLCLSGLQLNAAVCERYANSSVPRLTRATQTHGYEAVAAEVKTLGPARSAARLGQPSKEET